MNKHWEAMGWEKQNDSMEVSRTNIIYKWGGNSWWWSCGCWGEAVNEDGKALLPSLNQLEIRWCLTYIRTILKETNGIWVLLFLVYQQYLTAFWELKEINIQSAPNSYLHFKILLTSHKYSYLRRSCSWRQCFLYNGFVFSVGVCDGEAGTLMSLNGLLKNWKVNAGITSSAHQD